MSTYEELLEQAQLCLQRASEIPHPAIAEQLKRMAQIYQAQAARLYIGAPPEKPDTSADALRVHKGFSAR